MAEKGFTNAEINHKVTPVAGGPKLVNVTFIVGEGPKIKIREVDFVGNTAISDGTLAEEDEGEQAEGLPLVHHRRRHLQGSDVRRGRRQGRRLLPQQGLRRRPASAQPEVKMLEDSKDGKTRWVELRIPVTEGPRYRMGELTFDGNKRRHERRRCGRSTR